MNLWNETKSIPTCLPTRQVSRQMVWEAYQKVRSNKGSSGVDAISMQEFDANHSKHLYKEITLFDYPNCRMAIFDN